MNSPFAPSGRCTVLVVDDTPDNLSLMSDLLRTDYKVKLAPGGERALQIVAGESKPDLILLDIMMPDMDGYEVLRRLQFNPETEDIPVIFLTAMSAAEDESIGMELGAVDYITKPINPAIVMARVRNHLQLKLRTGFSGTAQPVSGAGGGQPHTRHGRAAGCHHPRDGISRGNA